MTRSHPEFLARDGYRLRRTMDAARLLPVFGTFLFLLPVLWAGGQSRGGYIYLFAIWIGLIVIAAVLSRRLKEPKAPSDSTNTQGPNDGSV